MDQQSTTFPIRLRETARPPDDTPLPGEKVGDVSRWCIVDDSGSWANSLTLPRADNSPEVILGSVCVDYTSYKIYIDGDNFAVAIASKAQVFQKWNNGRADKATPMTLTLESTFYQKGRYNDPTAAYTIRSGFTLRECGLDKQLQQCYFPGPGETPKLNERFVGDPFLNFDNMATLTWWYYLLPDNCGAGPAPSV